MKLSYFILILIIFSALISCREDKIVFPEEPVDAAIFVNSSPRGASIFYRNDFTGKITPDWIENLDQGYHRITLKYEGYTDTTVSIRLDVSQKKYLTIMMQKDE